MALTKSHNRMIADASINVKDFGAVGDGITDDTVAIQAAINASYGSSLYIPAGDYKTTSTLTISGPSYKSDTLKIIGVPYTSKIIPTISSGYAIVVDGNTKEQPLILDGLTIDGTNTSGTAKGIIFNRTMSSNISNLYVNNFPVANVVISENWNMIFINLESRHSAGIGLFLDNDTGYYTTTGAVNNITFVGGTVSLNDIGVQHTTSGSAYYLESIKYYGLNCSNTSNGFLIHNTDESLFSCVYLEGAIGGNNQMEFKDCNICRVEACHITELKTVFKITDSGRIVIDGGRQQSAVLAGDIFIEVTDSSVKLANVDVVGGGLGTFCKYTQIGTNTLSLIFENVRAVLFNTLFTETFADGTKTRIMFYAGCEGIVPTDVNTSVTASGIDREGYVYLAPAGNKIAKVGNSSTTGGTEQGWIEVDQEGTIGYIRVYSAK